MDGVVFEGEGDRFAQVGSSETGLGFLVDLGVLEIPFGDIPDALHVASQQVVFGVVFLCGAQVDKRRVVASLAGGVDCT